MQVSETCDHVTLGTKYADESWKDSDTENTWLR